MNYRIKIDKKGCVGHARCAARAPHLYDLDSDGYIATDGFEVPADEEANALAGARSCPERIITMLDAEGNPVMKLPAAMKLD